MAFVFKDTDCSECCPGLLRGCNVPQCRDGVQKGHGEAAPWRQRSGGDGAEPEAKVPPFCAPLWLNLLTAAAAAAAAALVLAAVRPAAAAERTALETSTAVWTVNISTNR